MGLGNELLGKERLGNGLLGKERLGNERPGEELLGGQLAEEVRLLKNIRAILCGSGLISWA